MEGIAKWHHGVPTAEQYEEAVREISERIETSSIDLVAADTELPKMENGHYVIKGIVDFKLRSWQMKPHR